MSKIGKKPIEIPDSVDLKLEGQTVKVSGSEGELTREVREEIGVKREEDVLKLFVEEETKESKGFWGLERSLINNMIKGVSEGFEKKLELVGVGYRARMEGQTLVVEVGFSHPVKVEQPEGVNITVEEGKIVVSGPDKEKVGQVAAKIRDIRPPEPYKGKGIQYEEEEIDKKEGKKAVGTE